MEPFRKPSHGYDEGSALATPYLTLACEEVGWLHEVRNGLR